MTLRSQGIVVEGGAEEVSTDAGQPQANEARTCKAPGRLTGSSRKPHRRLFCRWMTSMSRDSTLSYDKWLFLLY